MYVCTSIFVSAKLSAIITLKKFLDAVTSFMIMITSRPAVYFVTQGKKCT